MSRANKLVLGVLGAWILVVLAAAGSVATLPPPMPQFVIVVLTLAALAVVRMPAVRSWIDSHDVRLLVGFHLLRLVGIGFLVLAARGELPRGFAIPAGWGDIVVAVLAAVLLVAVHPGTRTGRKLYLAWNLLGLADILYVVATAARIGMESPPELSALFGFPMALVPFMLVPLIIVTHVLIVRRLFAPNAEIPDAHGT